MRAGVAVAARIERGEILREASGLRGQGVAAAKITAEHKLASMTDPDEIDQLKEGLVNEIRSIEESLARKKEAVRAE